MTIELRDKDDKVIAKIYDEDHVGIKDQKDFLDKVKEEYPTVTKVVSIDTPGTEGAISRFNNVLDALRNGQPTAEELATRINDRMDAFRYAYPTGYRYVDMTKSLGEDEDKVQKALKAHTQSLVRLANAWAELNMAMEQSDASNIAMHKSIDQQLEENRKKRREKEKNEPQFE